MDCGLLLPKWAGLDAKGKCNRDTVLGRLAIKLMFAWIHVCKPIWILYRLGPMSLLQAISLNGWLRLAYPRAQPDTLVVLQKSDLGHFNCSLSLSYGGL
jgi:hypothetical protein